VKLRIQFECQIGLNQQFVILKTIGKKANTTRG